MKKRSKRIFSILLSLVMVLGMMPAMSLTAWAATAPDVTWSANQSISENTNIGTLTIDADITVTIAEGTTVRVYCGIVATSHTLTVAGAGTLNVTGADGTAGEGDDGHGNGNSGGNGGHGFTGNIIVNGATVAVTGGTGGSGKDVPDGNSGGSGGPGGNGVEGNVTVNSGSIVATGGTGGQGGDGPEEGGNGGTGGYGINGTVTVNGGSATLTGGNGGTGGSGSDAGTAGNNGAAVSGAITGSAKGSDNQSAWTPVMGTTSTKQYVRVTAAPAQLEPVAYMAWDATESKLVEKTGDDACANYTKITPGTNSTLTTVPAGWYVITPGTAIVTQRLVVNGTVNMILMDGATLTASKGIKVPGTATLNIFAQSGGTGKLLAGTEDGTTATLTASDKAAGIGGSDNEDTGSINIHGGRITAMGGYAPGIGGAYHTGGDEHHYGGDITIYGGEINSTAGSQSAGIGSASGNRGGSVTIYGGTVNATSLQMAPGIGSGRSDTTGVDVTIYGGAVNARCGDNYSGGTGIGGGYYGKCGNITINGGTVTAIGGVDDRGVGGPGIGGGEQGTGIGNIVINGGTVTATGKGGSAGIGGFRSSSGSAGANVTINGGTVIATGSIVEGTGEVYDEGTRDFVNATYTYTGVAIGGCSYVDSIGTNNIGDNGSLTLGTGMYLYGGTSANPENNLAGAGSYTGDRYLYMTAKSAPPKPAQIITADDVTVTYGDTDKKVSATANDNGAISYAVKSGSEDYIDVNAGTGALTIKKVGTATVIVTAAETATYAQTTKEVTVTINKADVTGAPAYTAITATGKTLADAGLAAGTLAPAGDITWNDADTTEVTQGTAYGWTYTPSDSDNYNTKTGSITLWTATSHSSSSQPAATTVTVPVSGETESVNVTVTVNNNKATVTGADVDKVLKAEDVGTVTVDVSKLNNNVNEAVIPGKMVDKIADAVADKTNNTDGLEVKLPTGSVSFDADAVAAISEKTDGKDLTLHLDDVKVTELNSAQQSAVNDIQVEVVLDAYLTSGGERISDFNGGSATVKVPYTLKGDQTAAGLVVWYVANDGTRTQVPATYVNNEIVFSVPHFSNYIIAYDEARAAACPKDATCPISKFTDTSVKDWYHDGVHWALENGVMNGVSDGLFQPNGTVTRGMVMTMLARMEGVDTTAGAGQKWYDKGAAWAMEKGISDGTNPTASVTREQLATMLYRYAQSKGKGFTGAWMFLLDYPDATNVSEWADEAMHWCVMNEIINGMNGKLNPQSTATRAQVATMLMRYCEEVAK